MNTGVFWIGEFISTAIEIELCDVVCSAAICYIRLVLDVPNLLAVKILIVLDIHIECMSSIYSVLGTPHFPGDCMQEASVSWSEEKGDRADQRSVEDPGQDRDQQHLLRERDWDEVCEQSLIHITYVAKTDRNKCFSSHLENLGLITKAMNIILVRE